MESLRSFGWVAALALGVVGCNTGVHEPGTTLKDTARAGASTAPSTTASTPSVAPAASRLSPTAPGVQVGLRLLRGQVTAADAASAWQAEGLSPDAALDVVRRLPLTAPPAGDHSAQIADAFGRQTEIRVYVPTTPPGPEGYSVLLFFHGLGGDASQAAGLRAMAPDSIVVAASAQLPPPNAIFEDSGVGGGVAGQIAQQVIAQVMGQFKHWWVYMDRAFGLQALDYVRERYPIDTNRIRIGGASMGGFGANNVGLRYHDRFSSLAVVAGGISRFEFTGSRDPRSRQLWDNAVMLPTYVLHGDQDAVVPVQPARWSAADLQARGADHIYREVAGAGHDPASFGNVSALLEEVNQFARARPRDPSPARVDHRALGTYHSGAYWVRIDGLSGDGRVSARVTSRTSIEVTRENVSGVTVFLDPALVDVNTVVDIRVDGALASAQVVAPSLLAVAESFARTRDPALTYTRSVSLR